MNQVYIDQLKNHIGGEVTLKGWLYNSRSSGKLVFLQLRDGTGIVQCVVFKGNNEEVFEKAKSLGQESSIIVTGTVKEDSRSSIGVEIDVNDIEVLQNVHEYPITPKEHGTEFLMDNRHLWIRSKKQNAVLVPFGVEIKEMPLDKAEQKKKICNQYNIPPNTTLLLFNGALDYKPNTDALSFILDEINQLLLTHPNLDYRIIICGRGLPASFNELKNYADKNVIYAGFVDDVISYVKATDIFLNPVVTGGGVKTKIVEAMGYGATVISCETGAAGIEISVCGDKIKVVPDNDAQAFVTEIIQLKNTVKETPSSYYKYYYWGHITEKLRPLFKG